jgi:hypothetical protein
MLAIEKEFPPQHDSEAKLPPVTESQAKRDWDTWDPAHRASTTPPNTGPVSLFYDIHASQAASSLLQFFSKPQLLLTIVHLS